MLDLIFSPVVVSMLVGLTCMALALAFRPTRASQALEGRLSAFLSHAEMRQAADSMSDLNGSFLDRVVFPMVRKLLGLIGRMAPSQTLEGINEQLTIAGRPGNLSAADFVGIRLIFMLFCVGLAVFAGRTVGAGNPRMGLLVVGGCLAVGFLFPKQWLSGKIKARKDAIQCSLPDALDMLTICVEAGLAFESALQRVADQWEGPLSDEFSRVVAEIRLGVARTQALRRLAQRCSTPDVGSFVAVLVQADSMGTSIAQVLHSQADQIRTLRRQRAEEKANKAPIKVLVVMVLFIFPALFVVILGPAIPKILEAFSGTSM
jgi:tight adherence protein C